MSYREPLLRPFIAAAALLGAAAAFSQQPAAPAQAPAQASASGHSATLSSSLGLVVFPAKDQSAEKQSSDENACFGWAKTNTGIDPAAIVPQPATAQAPAPASSGGKEHAGARGAAKGAAGGALVGAVAGDAGTGAAVGATVGALSAGSKRRQAKKAEEQQQQQAASQQAQASVDQQKATYNKAFSACMEGKGYSVK